tara:strand:- start:2242 stop:2598 length:357 start_codon:yes stop_codon:yes gene_type:complete
MLLSHHSKSAKSINKSAKSVSKYSRSVCDVSPRILNISARMQNEQERKSVRDAASQRSMMNPSIAEPASVVGHSRASVSGFIGRSAVEPITPSVVGTNMDTKRREVTQTSHDGHKISM